MYVVDHAYSLIIIKVEFSLSYKSTSFSCSVKVFAAAKLPVNMLIM